MSIHLVVFVPRKARLPSAKLLSDAAASAGHVFQTGGDFDPSLHSGYLPVYCDGFDSGFEYFCDSISDYLDEVGSEFSFIRRWRLRKFAFAADFVTHSSHDERYAAIIAAASFTTAAGGLLLDCQSGKFISSSGAFAWADNEGDPPDPKSVANRRSIEIAAFNFLRDVLKPLGYSELDRAPDTSEHRGTIWFARLGQEFSTELVEVSVVADADKSFLSVSFFGSPYSVKKLRMDGLSGNAAGRYLSIFQHYDLERPYEEVLPQDIPIDGNFAESEEAARLKNEVQEASQILFRRLSESLKEKGEWWPDA